MLDSDIATILTWHSFGLEAVAKARLILRKVGVSDTARVVRTSSVSPPHKDHSSLFQRTEQSRLSASQPSGRCPGTLSGCPALCPFWIYLLGASLVSCCQERIYRGVNRLEGYYVDVRAGLLCKTKKSDSHRIKCIILNDLTHVHPTGRVLACMDLCASVDAPLLHFFWPIIIDINLKPRQLVSQSGLSNA